jgi:hypothetical protein
MDHRASGSPVNPLAEAAQQFESRLIVVERALPLGAAVRETPLLDVRAADVDALCVAEAAWRRVRGSDLAAPWTARKASIVVGKAGRRRRLQE